MEVNQMLVLSRKQSQRIKLGDSIVITVVRVAGDKVRLGIDAPRDMLVLRDELEPHADANLAGAGSLEIESLEIEVAAGELASLARSA
jgi:carbon storage regulator